MIETRERATSSLADALCEARSHLRHLMDRTTVAVAVVGLDRQIRQVNRQLCDLLGYREAELLQMTFADITHPDDRHRSISDYEAMVAGTLPRHQTIKRYLHRDGRIFYCRRIAFAAAGCDGRPVSMLVVIEPVGAI
jgi:PAS domain S-box-containing protein